MDKKRSERCRATLILTDSEYSSALAAALSTEGVEVNLNGIELEVTVHGTSISDLRARLNTAMRSLQAASEALSEVDAEAHSTRSW